MKPPTGGPSTGPIIADMVRVRERPHQPGLADGAEQHEPSDRHHHRAADALENAAQRELGDAVANAAQHRAAA